MDYFYYWIGHLAFAVVVFIIIKYILTSPKNGFEARLKNYIPKTDLPAERKSYLIGREGYVYNVLIVLGILVFLAPLLLLYYYVNSGYVSEYVPQMDILKELSTELPVIYLYITFLPYFGIVYWFLRFARLNTTRAQEMLLEEMSEEDFVYFQKMRKTSFFTKYSLPFVLCRENLYFFNGYRTDEIPINTIKKVTFTVRRHLIRDELRSVFIYHPKKSDVKVYERLYPYLVEFVQKYNPNAQCASPNNLPQ